MNPSATRVKKASREDSLAVLGISPEQPGRGESLLEYGRKLHRSEMQRLKMKHRAGMGGREVVLARSQLMDSLIKRIHAAVWQEGRGETEEGRREIEMSSTGKGKESKRPPAGMAIVALGGYGRRELAPYSDVDLMFLRKSHQNEEENLRIQTMLCLLWDMGFHVSHNVRTIKESLQMAQADLVSQISMLDARFIAGEETLLQKFSRDLQAAVLKDRDSFKRRLWQSIHERHANQGGTAFIQEPNVKEAKGGLRDFHCVLWMSKAFYPRQTLPEVLRKNAITQAEWSKASSAYEFLQRLRNELHFLTGRRTDTLSHVLLGPVIRNFAFRRIKFQKDSESFLNHYYLQARRISQVLEAVLVRFKNESRAQAEGRGSQRGFSKPDAGKNKRSNTPIQNPDSSQSPQKWMQLLRYSQSQPSLLDEPTRTAIRQNLQQFGRSAFSTSALAADFRAILRNKGQVAPVIRLMHELGFLGRVLPEFGRLTCLVQHDLYHKYTTDEHTLRALQILDQIAEGHPAHLPYQKILNEIHDSCSLYFALLMHDIGKGWGKGHSAKGAQLVGRALARLGFDPDEGEKIQALVQHHLLMGHVSQRRNLEDPHTIEEFVKTVERLDSLNMLLLMTYADAQAVAPGVWTEWKDYLLWELYYKAYDRLMFAEEMTAAGQAEVEAVQQQVAELLKGEIDDATIQDHFRLLPERYVLYTPISQMVQHLRLGQKLHHVNPVLEWLAHPDKGYTDLTLVTQDYPGLFAQIAGGLSAFNLNILSAQLNTRQDGMVFDVFQVGGLPGNHGLHPEDYPRVEKLLKQIILGQLNIENYLKSHSSSHRSTQIPRSSVAPRVRIDNSISPIASVIEVQADDRIGLGYQIAKTLTALQLNITFAKLATEKAHAFDVFYVHDHQGGKILDSARMAEIVERLRADLMPLHQE